MCSGLPRWVCLICLVSYLFTSSYAKPSRGSKLDTQAHSDPHIDVKCQYDDINGTQSTSCLFHNHTQLRYRDSIRELLRQNATHFYTMKLFQHFGHDGFMHFDDFVTLISELGLQTNLKFNASVVHSINHGPYSKPHRHRRNVNHIDAHKKDDINFTDLWNLSGILQNPCLSPKQILLVHQHNPNSQIDDRDLLAMCPSLIYQVIDKNCWRQPPEPELSIPEQLANIPSYKWVYSSIAVFIISLVGLLSVAVIPVMQKVFYHHLLQFLVALAVGALSGDALLHLLPHAIEGVLLDKDHGESHDEGGHSRRAMWIGMTGLASIIFFFIMERLLTIITRMKNSKKRKDTDLQLQNTEMQIYPEGGPNSASPPSSIPAQYKLCHDCEKVVTMMIHPNKELAELADGVLNEIGLQWKEKKKYRNTADAKDESLEVLNGMNSSHGHNHQHSVPNSVSAVAWMVILGDGIHNFSDGLAIGAGFASSIPVGVSTSIAVFCHELPHEIGDFAVLLRAGMKIKQAIAYNCLSSVLCFIGMFIGVAIGNISSASLWIFGVVAGMFLYIALVDMLPEMTAVMTKKGENQFCHLMLQLSGMLTGSTIMFLIAFFEDSIQNSF